MYQMHKCFKLSSLRSWLSLALLILFNVAVFAQQKNVKGKVTDDKGEALIGVTITIKDRKDGTITDIDGKYSLYKIKPSDIVTFSYMGMKTKSVMVGDKKVVNVTLSEDVEALEDVVVIGYGTVKRRDLTGAVKSIRSEDITGQSIVSAEQGLAGRVSGVKVVSDYAPGGGISVQVRGANSMMGGSEPLYVVDGFPIEPMRDAAGNNSAGESSVGSSMNFINPDDIENIEILKDASATAIYGARGANGVVLITTKSAKKNAGKSTVSYNFKMNVSHVSQSLDLMDSEEYANMINQREINRYWLEMEHPTYWFDKAKGIKSKAIDLKYDGVENPFPWELPNTDWQNSIYRVALSQSHAVNVKGGSNSTRYYVSFGYLGQEGIILNTDYERFNLASTINHDVNKRLSIVNKVTMNRSNANGGMVNSNDIWSNRSLVTSALFMQPFYDLNMELDDELADEGIDEFAKVNNPYLLAQRLVDKKINTVVLENFSANYKINKYLDAVGEFGVNFRLAERNQYWPSNTVKGKANKGIATISTSEGLTLRGDLRLNYNQRFGKSHALTAMGAVSYENTNSSSKYNDYKGFPDDELGYHGIASAVEQSPTRAGWSQSSMASGFARVNYKFQERYLVTATFRADGSSRFAENRKWGFFPSVAAAWRVTEEDFFPMNDIMNDMKVRVSYGRTGSISGIQPYRSLGVTDDVYGAFDDNPATGVIETNFANPDLTWETTDQYNGGIDFAFFNSKVLLTVDAYYKRTRDLLQQVSMPGSFGYTSRTVNMGEVENRGFEFELNLPIISGRNTNLTLNVNGGMNRSKLLSLGGNDYIVGPRIGEYSVNRFIVGQPLGVFWGWEADGVVRDWDEAEALGYKGLVPGEYKYVNHHVDYKKNPDGSYVMVDGKKVPQEQQVINDDDKVIIGDPNPDFNFGIGFNFNYKKLDASLLMTGQIGGDIFWYDYSMMSSNSSSFNNLSSCGEGAWAAPMQYVIYDEMGKAHVMGNAAGNINGATLPAFRDKNSRIAGANNTYRNTQMNSSNLFDASHLKIANISVGYTFAFKKAVENIRVAVAANNIFTFTKYPGYDPESASFVDNAMRRGIDFGSYPPNRTFTVSAAITF